MSQDLKSWPALSQVLDEAADSDVVVELTVDPERYVDRENEALTCIEAAISATYTAFIRSGNVRFETVAMLREPPRRRLTTWVRAVVRGREPPESALLNFCARGALAMLAWMDAPSALPLSDLQLAIKTLIEGTTIEGLPGLAAPASAELIGAITAWQKAKDVLYFVDRARFITKHGSTDLDLDKRIEDPKSLLVDRKLVNPATDIIFVIELPDYDCTGQWRLKHGETHVTATCAPGTLLDRFYSRELDLRPGDALHCRVEFGTSYGPDHEVISEDSRIVEILEIFRAGRHHEALIKEEKEDHAEEIVEEIEGGFGVLTLRRLPIN